MLYIYTYCYYNSIINVYFLASFKDYFDIFDDTLVQLVKQKRLFSKTVNY